MPIKNRPAQLHEEITGWRRDTNQHPEILFDTHRTSALVAEQLKGFRCDVVVTGIDRTGVVGFIEDNADTQCWVIGLRADTDAMPLKKKSRAGVCLENRGRDACLRA